MGLIVCLAGGIGSGKSSVSHGIVARLGWRHAGFGDYLRREIARHGGDSTSRQALQDLGQTLVDSDPEEFCRAVMASGGFEPGDNFILDGIRHESIYRAAIRAAHPSVPKLLFLQVPHDSRRDRVAERTDAGDFQRSESHRVESELRVGLPALADCVVDGTAPLEDVVEMCLAAIGRWRSTDT